MERLPSVVNQVVRESILRSVLLTRIVITLGDV